MATSEPTRRMKCDECQAVYCGSHTGAMVPCHKHNECGMCGGVISSLTVKLVFSVADLQTAKIVLTHEITVGGVPKICRLEYSINTLVYECPSIELASGPLVLDVSNKFRTVILTLEYNDASELTRRWGYLRFDECEDAARLHFEMDGRRHFKDYPAVHSHETPALELASFGGSFPSTISSGIPAIPRVHIASGHKRSHSIFGTPFKARAMPAVARADYRAHLKTPIGRPLVLTDLMSPKLLSEEDQTKELKKALGIL